MMILKTILFRLLRGLVFGLSINVGLSGIDAVNRQ